MHIIVRLLGFHGVLCVIAPVETDRGHVDGEVRFTRAQQTLFLIVCVPLPPIEGGTMYPTPTRHPAAAVRVRINFYYFALVHVILCYY